VYDLVLGDHVQPRVPGVDAVIARDERLGDLPELVRHHGVAHIAFPPASEPLRQTCVDVGRIPWRARAVVVTGSSGITPTHTREPETGFMKNADAMTCAVHAVYWVQNAPACGDLYAKFSLTRS